MRPAGGDGGPAARAAVAPLEDRIAALEAQVDDLRRERDATLEQGVEAQAIAMETRRALDRLREEVEDILSALDGASDARAPEEAAGSAGADTPAGTALASAGPPPPAASALEASAGPPLRPGDVEVVKQALDEIWRKEQEEQRAARQARQREAAARRLDRLGERLGLAAGQKEELAAIMEDARAARQEIARAARAGAGAGEPFDARAALGEVREEEDARLRAILSPTQYEEYRKIQDERRPQGLRRGGRRGVEAGADGAGATVR